jgi:flavodoxin
VSTERPKVLLVYYTFSHQTELAGTAMAAELEKRGAEVTKARIELTDKRWEKRFRVVPMKFPLWHIVGMLPAQIRQLTGEIKIPAEAQRGGYDLVVVGSPTWWLRLSLPMRSYLKSAEAKPVFAGTKFSAYSTSRRYWRGTIKDIKAMGEAHGGTYLDQTHFVAYGNQVTSMMSWLSYMSGFTMFNKLLHLPPSNLEDDYVHQAQDYINGIADRVFGAPSLAQPVTEPAPSEPAARSTPG